MRSGLGTGNKSRNIVIGVVTVLTQHYVFTVCIVLNEGKLTLYHLYIK